MRTDCDWPEFESLMSNEAGVRVRKLRTRSDHDVKSALLDTLFGSKGKPASTRKATRDEAHFQHVFSGFTELSSSIERLQDIEIYLGSFPYRSQKLSRVRFLRYQIESYFHEVYILKERLMAYLTTIGRTFRGDRRHAEVLRITRPIFSVVSSTLKDVTTTRNVHVHQKRFDQDDLSRLDAIHLITQSSMLPDAFRDYYDVEYLHVRREWKSRMSSNNKKIGKLLDVVAEQIAPALFNRRRRRMKYPRTSAT